MNACEQIRTQMTFYLDDELQGSERAALESHLSDCEPCREMFDAERQFLETVRSSRPLHTASAELCARVEKTLSDMPSPLTAPPALRHRVYNSLWHFSSKT